ncbi:hypothetical protein N7492_006275 [Penicillium capsulatum]|uniref:Uncharacterized protein n=1 Tax=Penicillium capsulatum TaxID=69766 RepID=A0A9W9I3S8_9EURO|nr:hypothetical protein N7492_006275 [Penicillium capsulatum]KAJ6108926.1 hypothetical protein N7512_008763 [Penicillium capsulatum]
MPMVSILPKPESKAQSPTARPNGPRRAEDTVPRDPHRLGASGKRLDVGSAEAYPHSLIIATKLGIVSLPAWLPHTGVRGLWGSRRDDWSRHCAFSVAHVAHVLPEPSGPVKRPLVVHAPISHVFTTFPMLELDRGPCEFTPGP